jgi:HlyD family secretion protein
LDDLTSDLASLKIDRTPEGPKSRTLPRVLAWIAVLGAVVGFIVWVSPRIGAQFFKTEVQTSSIVEVSPSLAVTTLTATGYVIAERRSKVGAEVTGKIARLYVREGSQVKQGELLVELDAADQKSKVAISEARVGAAEAKVASTQARLAELRVQLERQRGLLAQNAAARSVVEDLETRITTAEAEVKAARSDTRASAAEVQQARVTLNRMTVRAPIDGTVLDKPLDVGETVEPAKPLMEVADLSALVIEIDVPESRLSLVKVGGPTEIVLDAFGSKRFRGRVREIGRRVNRAKATVPVKVELTEDSTGVLPDMSARVSFLTQEVEQAQRDAPSKLVVPKAAVVSRDGKRVVFAVKEGAVRLELVELGPASGDGFELLRGPPAGTKVVLSPESTLESGQRIKERTD